MALIQSIRRSHIFLLTAVPISIPFLYPTRSKDRPRKDGNIHWENQGPPPHWDEEPLFPLLGAWTGVPRISEGKLPDLNRVPC